MSDLVERLKPRWAIDEEVVRAAASGGMIETVNKWLVQNNALKSEAATALTALEQDNAKLREDKARLDWLETMVVNVRSKLVYGSADVFWASPDDSVEGEIGPSDLRMLVDREKQLRALASQTSGGE